MCISNGFKGISQVLNPLGAPMAAIDPGGALVGQAVKATGVKGAPGAWLNGLSGLGGTIEEGKKFVNKTTTPIQDPAAPTAPAPNANLKIPQPVQNNNALTGMQQIMQGAQSRVAAASQSLVDAGLLSYPQSLTKQREVLG